MTGISTPTELCPHWSTKTTSKQITSFQQKQRSFDKRPHCTGTFHPTTEQASRVELRHFPFLNATYRRCVQRCDCGCGESMCGVLVVHYLHSMHRPREYGHAVCFCSLFDVKWWCCGAHETVLDSCGL